MKFTAPTLLSAAIALAGCVNQETFVKNNIQYSQYERDRAACETKATQEIPVNRSPGAEVAVAILTGVYQTQDANADARKRNYESCMMSKGYQRIELPMCPNISKARESGVGPLNAHEKISVGKDSCLVNDTMGRPVFARKPAS